MNFVTSLVGPDLADNAITPNAPVGSTITPNTSANNTQATLRRVYGVTQDAGTGILVINTGLPLQDGVFGSFALTLTPAAAPLSPSSGGEVYTRQLVAHYDPSTAILSVTENVSTLNDASYIVSVDLAHTATR